MFITNPNAISRVKDITYFLAQKTENEEPIKSTKDSYLVGSKIVSYTDKALYYIKYSGSRLINPYILSKAESAKQQWKWLKVNKETFTKYNEFLKTGSEVFYNSVQRSI